MARHREFDRDRALHKAMLVFWQHGYEATSTAVLVEELGIARSSLYATFGSKDALYAEAMDCYLADLRKRVIAELDREGPADLVLHKFFSGVASRGNLPDTPLRCCMVVRASLSRTEQPQEIRQRIDQAISELDGGFLALLERARAEQTLPANTDLANAAKFLTSTFQSLNLAAMVGRKPAELQELVDRALASLQLRPVAKPTLAAPNKGPTTS